MSVQYEVMAATGTYTDKNGVEKKRWLKCGVIMDTKNGGLAMKLEAVPVVGEGWFSLMPPRQESSQSAPPVISQSAKDDEDIPF